MFFDMQLLTRTGKFADPWLILHREQSQRIKLFPRKKMAEINIRKLCSQITKMLLTQSQNPAKRLSLRLVGHITYGTILLYQRQVHILYVDVMSIHEHCSRAYTLIEKKPRKRSSSGVQRKKKQTVKGSSDTATTQTLQTDPLSESRPTVDPSAISIIDADLVVPRQQRTDEQEWFGGPVNVSIENALAMLVQVDEELLGAPRSAEQPSELDKSSKRRVSFESDLTPLTPRKRRRVQEQQLITSSEIPEIPVEEPVLPEQSSIVQEANLIQEPVATPVRSVVTETSFELSEINFSLIRVPGRKKKGRQIIRLDESISISGNAITNRICFDIDTREHDIIPIRKYTAASVLLTTLCHRNMAPRLQSMPKWTPIDRDHGPVDLMGQNAATDISANKSAPKNNSSVDLSAITVSRRKSLPDVQAADQLAPNVSSTSASMLGNISELDERLTRSKGRKSAGPPAVLEPPTIPEESVPNMLEIPAQQDIQVADITQSKTKKLKTAPSEIPALQELSVTEQAPVIEQASVVEQAPVIEQASVATEKPVEPELPLTEIQRQAWKKIKMMWKKGINSILMTELCPPRTTPRRVAAATFRTILELHTKMRLRITTFPESLEIYSVEKLK